MLDKFSVDKGKEGPKNFIKNITDNSSEDTVNIIVKLNSDLIEKWRNSIGMDGLPQIENKLKLTSTLSTSNMYAFDADNRIHKFETIEELIDYWFDARIKIYSKRRNYILNKISKELDIIKFKVKFILEIIDNQRNINNKKKIEIINLLEKDGYPKIAEKDAEPSYDYLLNMNLYKLTFEEVEQLKNKKEVKQAEYNYLNSKSDKDIWSEDLDLLIKDWKVFHDKYNKEHKVLKI